MDVTESTSTASSSRTLMPTDYLLLVQSADGIRWKPGTKHGKTPSLYIAMYRNGVEAQRTPTIKRDIAPKWDYLLKILSDPPVSAISLRVFQKSPLPFGRDKCLGAVDIVIATLRELCESDSAAKLELTGADEETKGKPAGTLSVRFMSVTETASLAIDKAGKERERLVFGSGASAVGKAEGVVEESVSAANDLGSALLSLVSKLEVIVRIGDEIAAIHPYANVAWKVLTSVYQVVKKQQETDDKLQRLVETMVKVYSFVEDTEFLAQKIQSLKHKTLAIVKQTVECALFIQEYTVNGFCSRAVRSAWKSPDKTIEDLATKLLDLKASFDGSLTVQSLFLSTRILEEVQSLEKSDDLQRLHPVDMNASSRTLCLPGTRREILNEITEWITIPSDSGNVLWLSGVAGSGKSTISTTVADSFLTMHRLGAFLFFDRNDSACSHPDAVIRTLAYSLALSNPHIGSAICTVIKENPAIVNAPIGTQFKALLLEPLAAVESSIHGPILIILDALDECGDPGSRAMLLSLLAKEFPKLPRLFRIIITSRRDPDIALHFRSLVSEKRDLDNSGHSNNRDVDFFLRHEIANIQHTRGLPPTWPGEDKLRALINLSGGLFIWASTAIKFIDDYSPDDQFNILTDKNFADGFTLDVLYDVALWSSRPWATNKKFAHDARVVLACVVLGKVPMTEKTMDKLLFSGKPTAGDVLGYLGCVVQWSPGKEARTLHASFADYLTDPTRSGGQPWSIDPNADHHSLSVGCLRVLQDELRFNMCRLESSHHRNVDIPNITHRVATMISPQLAYASCFWATHIQETPFENTLLQAINTLLHQKFLFWVEALSLLGQIPIGKSLLEGIARYAKGHTTDFEDFVADMIKFMGAFGPPIAQSTPHIYVSALPFTPRQSKIAKELVPSLVQTLRVQGPLCEDWLGISKILWGHTKSVESVCFSPDRTWVASGSRDNTVHMWDVQTGVLVAGPFEGHTSWVTSVHFSPDGARIGSGSLDSTVRVWDAKTGALLAGPFQGHTGTVHSVKFSPDSSRIASGSKDGTVRVWDTQTGVPVAGPFEGHTKSVLSVDFSPDGTRVASGSADCTLRVWDAQTGVLLSGPFKGHAGVVASVCFSLDSTRIASGSWDKTVCVWNAQSATLIAGPFEGHTDCVTSVHFSVDGAKIASGSWDHTVYVWDAKTGSIVTGPLQGHSNWVNSVSFSSDGSHLASGSNDHTVRIWDVQTSPQVVGPFEGHTQSVTSVSFSPDSTHIVTGCDDNTLCVWDAQTGALVAGPVEGHTGSFSSDGARIVSGSQKNTVHVWDSRTGVTIIGPFEGHTGRVVSVDFSPDGVHIASGSADKTLRVWDTRTGEALAGPFKGHTSRVTSVHFSPDGGRIASGSLDETVRVWDAHTGKLIAGPFEGHKNWVTSVNFSPDGTKIASGSWDHTVRVWDAQTGALVAGPFKGHTNNVNSVKFSRHGNLVASGSDDKTVRIWDAQGALVAGPFEGHTNSVNAVDFSPDGTRIVSGSDDTTVRVWELNPSVSDPLGDSPRIENDWGLNSTGDLMFWIPPWLREGIYLPRNTLVICARGTTKVKYSRFVHGTDWEKCIAPKVGSAKSH